ncbi:MAG: protein kinase [archaeon]|nr:protein kinase [archaeon]
MDTLQSPLIPLDVLGLCESGFLQPDDPEESRLEALLIEKRSELTVHPDRQFLLRVRSLLQLDSSNSPASSPRVPTSPIFSEPLALSSLSAPTLSAYVGCLTFLLAYDIHPSFLFLYQSSTSSTCSNSDPKTPTALNINANADANQSKLPETFDLEAPFGQQDLIPHAVMPEAAAAPLHRALGVFFLLARWVVHAILRQSTNANRAHLMGKFIFVTNLLQTQHNMFGASVIMCALNHVAVYRLKDTWRRIPKHLLDILIALRTNFPYSSNPTAPIAPSAFHAHFLEANRGKFLVSLPLLLHSLRALRFQYASQSCLSLAPGAPPSFELCQALYDPILNFHLTAHQPGMASRFCNINDLHGDSVSFLNSALSAVSQISFDELLTMSLEIESPFGVTDQRRGLQDAAGGASKRWMMDNAEGSVGDGRASLLRQVSIVKSTNLTSTSNSSPSSCSPSISSSARRIFRIKLCDDPVMRKMGISNTLKSVTISSFTDQAELKRLLLKQITRGMTEDQSKLISKHTQDFDIFMVIDDDLECKIDAKLQPWSLLDERPVPDFVFRSVAAPSGKLYAPVGHPIEVWWMALADPNVVSEYLQAGFFADTRNPDMNHQTGLQIACQKGCLEVVSLLLKHGANVDASLPECKLAPLHHAIQNSFVEIVSLLLRSGADANRRGERLRTPLMYAATIGNRAITSLLLFHGVDVNAQDASGSTALHLATAKAHLDVVGLFVEYANNTNSSAAFLSASFSAPNLSLVAPSSPSLPPASPLSSAPSTPSVPSPNLQGLEASPSTPISPPLSSSPPSSLSLSGAPIPINFSLLDNNGLTALHVAARSNHLAVFKALLPVAPKETFLLLREGAPNPVLPTAKHGTACHRILSVLNGGPMNLGDCSLSNGELQWILQTLLNADPVLFASRFDPQKPRSDTKRLRSRTKGRVLSLDAASPYSSWLLSILQMDLRTNCLTDLPESILRFSKLQKIDLRHNNLDTIPPILPRMATLKSLVITNNPLRNLPAEVVQLPTEELLSYIRSFEADSLPWTQLKLMVVGAEAVGKTSLIRRLVPAYRPKLDANNTTLSTEGISIVSWKPEPEDAEMVQASWLLQAKDLETEYLYADATGAVGLGFEIQVLSSLSIDPHFKVWDLGGQVIFYPTHQFFLTQRCVYVVVFNVARFRKAEIARVEYWLRQIKSASGGMFKPPIVLVGTHWDRLSDEERIPTLKRVDRWSAFVRQSYNVRDLLYVSTVTDAGIQRLKSVIATTGRSLVRNIPGTYLKYALSLAALQEQGTKHIDRAKALEMGIAAGLVPSEVDTALKFLHNTGAVLHWSEDDSNQVLHDLVVLNPQWLADAMSALVTFRAEQWVRNGVSSEVNLRRVWKGNGFDDSECTQLLALLSNFEIIHSLRTQPSFSQQQKASTGAAANAVNYLIFENSYVDPELYPSGSSAAAQRGTAHFKVGLSDSQNAIPSSEMLLLIPCLLPDSLPSYRALTRLLRATESKPVVCRIYQFTHLPVGLSARLIVRLLHKPNIHLRAVWKTGAVLESVYGAGSERSVGSALVEFDDNTFTLMIQQLHRRDGENNEMFSRLIYSADSLIASYYPGLERSVVRKAPCRHCLAANFPSGEFLSLSDIMHPLNTHFLLSDCFVAASNPSRPFMHCNGTPVRVEYVAPDLAVCGVPVIQHLQQGRLLGEGGFGEVYLATLESDSGRIEVALKTLKISDGSSIEAISEIFERFRREIWIMSLLNHPYLVHLYGMTECPHHAMVMEYLPLGDLYHLLDPFDKVILTRPFTLPDGKILEAGSLIKVRQDLATGEHTGSVDGRLIPVSSDLFEVKHASRPESQLPWLLRVKIARDIASGMAYLQSLAPPIVHRDLRSPNVFITSMDPRAIINAKVADFGLAQLVEHSVGGGLATFQWLAPEIIRIGGLPIYDERSDIYSFAMVMYELSSRSVPFMEDYWAKYTERSGKFDEIGCITDITTNNLRPIVPPSTPPAYRQLMVESWDGNPHRRPSFDVLGARLTDLLRTMDPTLPCLSSELFMKARLELQMLHERVIATTTSSAFPRPAQAAVTYELALSHMFHYPSALPTRLASLTTGGHDRVWCIHEQGKISVWHGQRAELENSLSTSNGHEEVPTLLLPLSEVDSMLTFDSLGQVTFWNASSLEAVASTNIGCQFSAVLDVTTPAFFNASQNSSSGFEPSSAASTSASVSPSPSRKAWEPRPFNSDNLPLRPSLDTAQLCASS